MSGAHLTLREQPRSRPGNLNREDLSLPQDSGAGQQRAISKSRLAGFTGVTAVRSYHWVAAGKLRCRACINDLYASKGRRVKCWPSLCLGLPGERLPRRDCQQLHKACQSRTERLAVCGPSLHKGMGHNDFGIDLRIRGARRVGQSPIRSAQDSGRTRIIAQLGSPTSRRSLPLGRGSPAVRDRTGCRCRVHFRRGSRRRARGGSSD